MFVMRNYCTFLIFLRVFDDAQYLFVFGNFNIYVTMVNSNLWLKDHIQL